MIACFDVEIEARIIVGGGWYGVRARRWTLEHAFGDFGCLGHGAHLSPFLLKEIESMVAIPSLRIDCHQFGVLLLEVLEGLSQDKGVEGFRALSHDLQLFAPLLLYRSRSFGNGLDYTVVGVFIAIDDNVGNESHLGGLYMKVPYREALTWVTVEKASAVALGEVQDFIRSDGTFYARAAQISAGFYDSYTSQTFWNPPQRLLSGNEKG